MSLLLVNKMFYLDIIYFETIERFHYHCGCGNRKTNIFTSRELFMIKSCNYSFPLYLVLNLFLSRIPLIAGSWVLQDGHRLTDVSVIWWPSRQFPIVIWLQRCDVGTSWCRIPELFCQSIIVIADISVSCRWYSRSPAGPGRQFTAALMTATALVPTPDIMTIADKI